MTISANISVSVHEGDPLQIFCAAEGNPTPSVSLYREVINQGLNDEFGYDEEVFAVSKAKPEHAGSYLCFGSQYRFAAVEEHRSAPTITIETVSITVTVLGESVSWAL